MSGQTLWMAGPAVPAATRVKGVYQLAAYIHLLAAIIWLGGMLFLAMVLVPVTRRIQEPPGSATRLLAVAARRFRLVAWGALAILVGTGIWILLERGVSPIDALRGGGWYFEALRVKVVLVVVVISLSAVHDFLIGPRLARNLEALGRPSPSTSSVARQRMVVSWLARINLLLVLAIVALGVVLVRGAPF